MSLKPLLSLDLSLPIFHALPASGLGTSKPGLAITLVWNYSLERKANLADTDEIYRIESKAQPIKYTREAIVLRWKACTMVSINTTKIGET